jgi:ferredoxin-type protein NapF
MGESAKLSRRGFLTGRIKSPPCIRPPGFAASASDLCTGCGACVGACPTGIIMLVADLPTISFVGGECTFCAACAEACPEPVFGAPGKLACSNRCKSGLGKG